MRKALKPHCVSQNGKTGRQTHGQIEDASTLFASPRLMHANQTSVKRSRAKRHIAFARHDRFDQFRRFGNRRRKIGIGKQGYVTARSQQSQPDCSSFSKI